MSKIVQLALKQLRQSAANLHLESQDGASGTDEYRDFMRSARHLVEQVANAVESGAWYQVASGAQEFDHANDVRTKPDLHPNGKGSV